MKWEDLQKLIEQMTPEQRKQDVTVFIRGVDEFYPVNHSLKISTEEDAAGGVLDAGSPYLMV